jgi:hypothetical protein
MQYAVRRRPDGVSARGVRLRPGRPRRRRPGRCRGPRTGTPRLPRSADRPPSPRRPAVVRVRCANREEQLRIFVTAGGPVSPVHALRPSVGAGPRARPPCGCFASCAHLVNSFTKWSGPLQPSIVTTGCWRRYCLVASLSRCFFWTLDRRVRLGKRLRRDCPDRDCGTRHTRRGPGTGSLGASSKPHRGKVTTKVRSVPGDSGGLSRYARLLQQVPSIPRNRMNQTKPLARTESAGSERPCSHAQSPGR